MVGAQLSKGCQRPGKEERDLGNLIALQRVALLLGGHIHGDGVVGRRDGAQGAGQAVVIGRGLFQGQKLAVHVTEQGEPVRVLVAAARDQRVEADPGAVALPFVAKGDPAAGKI